MDVRPGYKQTEAGVIPEDWQTKKLGECTSIYVGGDVDDERFSFHQDGECPYPVYSNTVDNFGLYGYYNQSDFKGDSLTVVGRGIGIGTAFRRSGGYGAIGRLIVLFPKNGVDAGYLVGYINHRLKLFEECGGIPQLTGISLANYRIPLPPLNEQRAIAATLADADGQLAGLGQLIAKKRDVKQGAMQALLTRGRRLPGFKGEWKEQKLSDLLRIQVGCPFESILFNEKEIGIRLLRNRDLKSDDEVVHYHGQYDTTYLVNNGDVLVGMDADFIPCVWDRGIGLLNQRVGRVHITSKADRLFFSYFLKKPLKDIEKETSSTTVKHLSHRDIEKIELPIPSLDEQTAIATVLSDMDAEIAALEARRDKMKQVKQGQMQELLTGRIRLT